MSNSVTVHSSFLILLTGSIFHFTGQVSLVLTAALDQEVNEETRGGLEVASPRFAKGSGWLQDILYYFLVSLMVVNHFPSSI